MDLSYKLSLVAKSAAVAGAALFALAAQPAAANTISIGGGVASITCSDGVGDPDNDCETIIGGSLTSPTSAGSTSTTTGDLYDVSPSSAANEAAALNILTGTTSFTTGAQTAGDGSLSFTFTTVAEWVLVKLGKAGSFFIHNTADVMTLTVNFLGTDGTGTGFSHYTEFGVVPLPAAFWLMGAGLAGLGFARGRERKKTG